MKGPNYIEELNESREIIEVLGGKLEKIDTFNLDGEMERNILIIKKIKSTPNKFPRKQGKSSKKAIR